MAKYLYSCDIPAFVEEGEEWRPIAGTNGLYEVSSVGRVRRTPTTTVEMTLDGTIVAERSRDYYYLTPTLGCHGYYQLGLTVNGKTTVTAVHIMVARAFCERLEGSVEVHHIDGISINNRRENLMWLSADEHSLLHCRKHKRDYLSVAN